MNINKRIIRVLVVIALLFLALASYLLWFNMFRAQSVYTNSYNRRQWESEQKIKRGSIYSSEGEQRRLAHPPLSARQAVFACYRLFVSGLRQDAA